MQYKTVFVTLIFSLIIISKSLMAQTTTVFNEEKFSLGLGVGVQYSFFGFQGKYFFSDYIGAIANTTYSPYGILWNVGAELRIPDPRPGRISPYFDLLIGSNSFSNLESFGSSGPIGSTFEFIKERKAFIGVTIASGIKWDIANRNNSYLKLGFDFRIINKSNTEFIDSFNARYLTTHSTNMNRFLPSIGYIFCLSRKSQPSKNRRLDRSSK